MIRSEMEMNVITLSAFGYFSFAMEEILRIFSRFRKYFDIDFNYRTAISITIRICNDFCIDNKCYVEQINRLR